MKPIIFHREARAELDGAIAFHEGRKLGLGLDLLEQVQSAHARIEENPLLYPRYKHTEFRKCVVKQFPFTLFYQDMETCIWIAAIAHQSRRPDYWINRTAE